MFYVEILRILAVVNNNFFGTQGFSLRRDVGYIANYMNLGLTERELLSIPKAGNDSRL